MRPSSPGGDARGALLAAQGAVNHGTGRADLQTLSAAWGNVLADLRQGPATLGSHPSSEAPLATPVLGLGTRPSAAVARTAVSLAFLRAFHERLVQPLSAGEPPPTTKAVVERFVKPLAAGCNCLADLLPPAAVGKPTAFISHAWGTCHYAEPPQCGCASGAGTFALLVDSVCDFFSSAVAEEVFVWLDMFAINQHDVTGSELDGGLTLELTLNIAAHTLVVLDRRNALPLTRLWCLYEVGSTAPEKLHLLTRGYAAAEQHARFRAVNVRAASCYDNADQPLFFDNFIRGEIRRLHGTQELFEQKLKMLLLLQPLSYEADMKALLANCGRDEWRFNELHDFLARPGGGTQTRMACVVGGPGQGKSTIAAALCRHSGVVHAHHFCKASDAQRQNPGVVVRSLAYQLATTRADATTLRFPAFAEALLALDGETLEGLSDPTEAFEVLLKRPLLQLGHGQSVVLLVDALDEAEVPERPVSKLLYLLLSLCRLENGPALRIIATTRPEAVILDALQARLQAAFWRFSPDTLRSAAESAEASRLLLLLNNRFAECGLEAADTVDSAYKRLFDVAQLDNKQRLLVDVVLAARQPPSLMLLEELGLRAALAGLPVTLFYERDFCVQTLHRSLSEWLLDAGRSGVHACNEARGHVALAGALTQQLSRWMIDGGAAPPSGSYVYPHVLSHLSACYRAEEACGLLLQLPWLQATLRERGIFALIKDLAAHAARDGDVALVHRAILLAAPGLQGPEAWEMLPGALCGRLIAAAGEADARPRILSLYASACAWRGERAWLRPLTAALAQPSGATELQLRGHASPVRCVAALPDGRVVSASDDATLRVWSVATGECERVLEGHTGQVTCVATLPDGRVVSGSWDTALRVWNVATGECERVLRGHSELISCLAVLGDGTVVSGSSDTTLRVWDVHTGECLRVLAGGFSAIPCVAALLDGRVVSASNDAALSVWSVQTGQVERVLRGHTRVVWSLCVLPDGRLVSGSTDHTVRVWDAATGECGRVLSHAHRVQSLAVLGDGRVVSASDDATLRVWSLQTGKCERVLPLSARVQTVAALGDGRVVFGSDLMTLHVCNLSTNQSSPVGRAGFVDCMAVVGNGRVVTGCKDQPMRVWNTATGECEHVLEGKGVDCMAVVGNGRVVTGCKDQPMRVWNAATGECEHVLEGKGSSDITELVDLRDGRFASRSKDANENYRFRAWDLVTGKTKGLVVKEEDRHLLKALLKENRERREVAPSPFKAHGLWLLCAGMIPTYCDGEVSKHVLVVDVGGGERTVAAAVGDMLHFFKFSH